MQDRYSRQYPTQQQPPKKDDCKCKEKDTATQRAINLERQTYCLDLGTTSGDVSKWEENYKGQKELDNSEWNLSKNNDDGQNSIFSAKIRYFRKCQKIESLTKNPNL